MTIFNPVFKILQENYSVEFDSETITYGWHKKSAGRKCIYENQIFWCKVIYREKGNKKGIFNDKLWNGEESSQKIIISKKPKIYQIIKLEYEKFEIKIYLFEYISDKVVSNKQYLDSTDRIDKEIIDEIVLNIFELEKYITKREGMRDEYIIRRIQSVFPEVANLTVNKWSTSHTDLHWNNITERGYILDWESWGVAIYGNDFAKLYVMSLLNEKIATYLKTKYKEVFNQKETKIAILYNISEVIYMNKIYGDFGDNFVKECLMESKFFIQ